MSNERFDFVADCPACNKRHSFEARRRQRHHGTGAPAALEHNPRFRKRGTLSTPAAALASIANQIAKEGLHSKNATGLASEVAKTFNVRKHEVGILMREKQLLRFVFPAKLATAGTVPISASTVAVAARVANTKTPEIINNLAQTKHASVFEAVLVDGKPGAGHKPTQDDKAAIIIQKMMTVPLLGPAGVIGVIEVSRKGKSAPEAGADFTPADLQKLVAIATSVARGLK